MKIFPLRNCRNKSFFLKILRGVIQIEEEFDSEQFNLSPGVNRD
jgi:hypothetical protein